MPEASPLIPQWLALAAGTIALIVLAGHLLALNAASDINPRRRRIRMTNAVLMMLVVPFVAYGFGIATPSRGRSYVYVWSITAAMLILIILVALIDVLHSWQLSRAQLRDARRQMIIARGLDAHAASLAAAAKAQKPGDAPRP
jgi:prepilin signal peptidase PulO-like enzyme (type II secretory pathway)